jgi:hypothetical protein
MSSSGGEASGRNPPCCDASSRDVPPTASRLPVAGLLPRGRLTMRVAVSSSLVVVGTGAAAVAGSGLVASILSADASNAASCSRRSLDWTSLAAAMPSSMRPFSRRCHAREEHSRDSVLPQPAGVMDAPTEAGVCYEQL